MLRAMRQERIKRGWSREYVAERAGVTTEAIRLIEVGERNPSYQTLVKLEDLFNMNHRTLFGAATPDEDPPGGNRADQENTQNHDSMTGVPGQDQ